MRGLLRWAAVGAGGAIGSTGRYAVDVWIGAPGAGTWPWATFAVNIVGCLLIGVLIGAVAADPRREAWRPFLGVGVLGGFTTYSAFAVETVDLLDKGALLVGLGYVLASIVGGIGAVAAGQRLVRS